jgi:hypothetical protein
MEVQAKGHHFSGASRSNNDGSKPIEECKATVFQALYEWFKEMPFTNLNRNYLVLGEVVGKEAFMGRMRRLFFWRGVGRGQTEAWLLRMVGGQACGRAVQHTASS